MSVVSPLFPITMEDPLADTMDVTSPYPGHVDDFELDIDIMEDQASNVDIDFDVRDASPAAMQQPEAPDGLLHDADMMDDVADPAIANAESRPRNDGTFYSGRVTYESDMLDEEYNEDIDAAIPEVVIEEADREVGEEPSGPQDENQQPQDDQGAQSVEEEYDGGVGIDADRQEEATQDVAQSETKLLTEEYHEPESSRGEQLDAPEELANPADIVELKRSPVLSDTDAQPSHAPVEGDAVQQSVPHDVGNQHIEHTEPEDDFENESHVTNDQERYLHPVKVLYQDSEISMFPPREGDSSETFFLENEALAYEDFGSLLVACRHVLGDHASDEESLVVDIDSLCLQITEDNVHVSKTTLSQLVDTYLRLCHNDGTESPGPLYLTLSTKPSLSTEVAGLVSAADEGKGISQIQSWNQDDLHQEERIAEASDQADNQAKESSNTTVNATLDDGLGGEKEYVDHAVHVEPVSDETASKEEAVHEEEHADAEETAAEADQSGFTATDAAENENAGELEVVALDDDGHAHESTDPHTTDAVDVPPEERYDSEDHTESTGTVVQTSLAQSDQHEHDETVENLDQDYFHFEDEDYDDEGYEEEETAPDEDVAPPELNQENDLVDHDKEYGDDENEEEYGEVTAQDWDNHDDELQSGEFDDTTTTHQNIVDSTEGQSTPQQAPDPEKNQPHDLETDQHPEESSERQPDQTVRQTPGLAEDLLDFPDDIFASPDKNAKQADSTLMEEPEKVADGEEPDNDLDVIDFDEDFLEINDFERTEDGSGAFNDDRTELPGNTTGKRSRDSEDELDLSETPTPDAKRTRSS